MGISFKAAGPAPIEGASLWILTKLLLGVVRKDENLKLIGDSVNYLGWLQELFGPINPLRTRESLWRSMITSMKDDIWTVYEFGVAWGYVTNFWLSQDLPKLDQWHGFDRFTGLPRAWRDFEKGSFDAQGQPPAISDPRLTWHIGNVEETLPMVKHITSRKCLLLDLDLYEPTLFAFDHMSGHLSSGDILYFDELFDRDEQKVVMNFLLPRFDIKLIGCTPLAAAFQIEAVKTSPLN